MLTCSCSLSKIHLTTTLPITSRLMCLLTSCCFPTSIYLVLIDRSFPPLTSLLSNFLLGFLHFTGYGAFLWSHLVLLHISFARLLNPNFPPAPPLLELTVFHLVYKPYRWQTLQPPPHSIHLNTVPCQFLFIRLGLQFIPLPRHLIISRCYTSETTSPAGKPHTARILLCSADVTIERIKPFNSTRVTTYL